MDDVRGLVRDKSKELEITFADMSVAVGQGPYIYFPVRTFAGSRSAWADREKSNCKAQRRNASSRRSSGPRRHVDDLEYRIAGGASVNR